VAHISKRITEKNRGHFFFSVMHTQQKKVSEYNGLLRFPFNFQILLKNEKLLKKAELFPN